MEFEPATPDDLAIVATQLGRPPTKVAGIAARCPAGHPSVVLNHPLHRRSGRLVPFPTLFWLTCPQLSRAVSRLEMAGRIVELERRLAEDDDLAQALHRDHRSYVEERWQLLSAEDQQEVRESGLLETFEERGIGGMANWRSVKCLHLHLAHHLARRNVLGALLAEEHGLKPCE